MVFSGAGSERQLEGQTGPSFRLVSGLTRHLILSDWVGRYYCSDISLDCGVSQRRGPAEDFYANLARQSEAAVIRIEFYFPFGKDACCRDDACNARLFRGIRAAQRSWRRS